MEYKIEGKVKLCFESFPKMEISYESSVVESVIFGKMKSTGATGEHQAQIHYA